MKYTLIAIIIFVTNLNAQIITFSDLNFKNELLASTANVGPVYFIASDVNGDNMAVDANNNGQIEVVEAQAVYKLQVQNRNISNLSGIEYFTNLIDLNCADNQLTSLDVSDLTNLQVFRCDRNDISTLNIEGVNDLTFFAYGGNNLPNVNLNPLTNISFLSCDNNNITNLDVSSLTSLYFLICSDNNLKSLNIASQFNLSSLFCDYNQLTDLDLSQMNMSSLRCNNNPLVNLNMKTGDLFSNNLVTSSNMNFSNCPTLTNICVDNFNINKIQNKVNGYGYENCSVNSNCNLSAENFEFSREIKLFPNPASNVLNIESDYNLKISTVSVYNFSGQVVLFSKSVQDKNVVDVAALKRGVYLLEISTENQTILKKFIIE